MSNLEGLIKEFISPNLSSLEICFIYHLINAYPNRLTTQRLYDAVWGGSDFIDPITISNQARRLKRNFESKLKIYYQHLNIKIKSFKDRQGGYLLEIN